MDFDTSAIYRLQGKVQHYDWGGRQFIPSLLKVDNSANQPFAEYWMGAHGKNTALISSDGKSWQPLESMIADHKAEALGEAVADRFGGLPYLFKVLDVRDMLSIQVHPDKQAAAIEFERENAEGIPLNAANRNYKDANHKPEMLVALGTFWLLHGFRSEKEIKAILAGESELNVFLPVFSEGNYQELYDHIMQLPQEEVNKILVPLLQRLIPPYKAGQLEKSNPGFWAARAALNFPGQHIDRGIFSIYLLNLVKLEDGEAIFQSAGLPHAYLEGQNLEIMANSDNVLRGGLTTKHIDVRELMKHVRFEAVMPEIIRPKRIDEHRSVYRTPAEDFEILKLELGEGDKTEYSATSAEIIFMVQGVAMIEASNRLNVREGEAAMIFAGCRIKVSASKSARIFIATVPVHSGE